MWNVRCTLRRNVENAPRFRLDGEHAEADWIAAVEDEDFRTRGGRYQPIRVGAKADLWRQMRHRREIYPPLRVGVEALD